MYVVAVRREGLRRRGSDAESISDMESDEEKGAATGSEHKQKRRRLQGRHASLKADGYVIKFFGDT